MDPNRRNRKRQGFQTEFPVNPNPDANPNPQVPVPVPQNLADQLANSNAQLAAVQAQCLPLQNQLNEQQQQNAVMRAALLGRIPDPVNAGQQIISPRNYLAHSLETALNFGANRAIDQRNLAALELKGEADVYQQENQTLNEALTQRVPDDQGQQIISPQNTLAREIESERNQFETDAGRHVRELDTELNKLKDYAVEHLQRTKPGTNEPFDDNTVAKQLQAQLVELQAQAQTNGDLEGQYAQCQTDLAQLGAELSLKLEALDETTQQLNSCTQQYEQLQIQIQQFNNKETAQNTEHQRKLDEINKEHTQKFNELQQGYQSALNQNNAQKIAEYNRLLQEENDRSQQALASANQQYNLEIQNQRTALDNKLKILEAQHNQLVAEIGEKQAEVTETLGKHYDCEERLKGVKAELDKCNNERIKDETTIKQKDTEINFIKRQLSESEGLKQQFEDLQARFEALKAEKDRLQAQFAEDIFGEGIGLGSGLASGLGAFPGNAMQIAAPIVRQMTPAQPVDSALNAYASGYAREMSVYSAMANEIVARAVQENAFYVVSNDNMDKYVKEYNRQKLTGDEDINVSYTVANPNQTFTQYQIDNVRLLEIFAENNCFKCWRDIRANIDGRLMPWTVGIPGALTIADLLISSLDYTYMILTSTPFMGVFTDTKKYPSINKFIKEKDALFKVAFATTQSRTTLESVEVLTLTTLVVLSLSELIYATYYNPSDCVENVKAQTAVDKIIKDDATGEAKKSKDKKKTAGKGAEAAAKTPAASAAKASGGVPVPVPVPVPAAAGEMNPLIFATVNLMCKFLSTKSLLDVGISAVLYKFMKCTTNKGFAFFTSDGSAASDASIRGVPTYSQITFYVGETTTLNGNKVDKYNCKRVFCIDDPAIAGYLWIVKNVMTKYEAFKQTNPGASIITFLARPETSALLGLEESFIFTEIYFMGDPTKQNPQLYSTIYDDATSLASDGVMSQAFTAMLGKRMEVGGMEVQGGQTPTIYDRLKHIGYNDIGYGFDADLYKCSTLSRLMFNKKFGQMTEPEFQKYITMTTLDYMRHDYEGKGGGAKPSSVRYLLLGLNLMRKMRRFKLDKRIELPPLAVNAIEEDDDYKADYSWVTRITGPQVTELMTDLQAELTNEDRQEIASMTDEAKFKEYLDIYKKAITPEDIFYWPLHPALVPGAGIKGAGGVLVAANDSNGARKQLFNTYLYMAAKSVADYEGDLFREELHIYGITSKGTPRVWLAGINKLAVKKTHDSVLTNVTFIGRLAAYNILLANTPIPILQNGVVDLQLSLSSINTQAKSVIGIDATNSADGNSGTTEDPRSTTVVEYLQPTKGFVNGMQICTIYSGSNSTGIVYSPQDIWDIEFLNGAILCNIRPENFVMIEKTAPATIKKLSEFSRSDAVTAEIAKITLNPQQPPPPTQELIAALESVKTLVPPAAPAVEQAEMDEGKESKTEIYTFSTEDKKIVEAVLGDINIESVNETTEVPAPVPAEEAAEPAVTTFKDAVQTQLKTFSDVFGEYAKNYDYNGKKLKVKKDPTKSFTRPWPDGAVKENFVKIIQDEVRLRVVNINTAYNTMLKSITEMAFSIVAVMSINAAVNTIFGILYTTLASQVQVFQEEQNALMAEPDVKIRVSSRKGDADAKSGASAAAANPIAYRPMFGTNQGVAIPIFPVDAAIMAGGGLVNDNSQPKGKSKNKDTRSFKVKSDKKTSRKKK